MNITFLEPQVNQDALSGGSLYNLRLCEQLRDQGCQLRRLSPAVAGTDLSGCREAYIIDSMCLFNKAGADRVLRLSRDSLRLVLVHVLASQLETSPWKRAGLRVQERMVLRQADHILSVSGETAYDVWKLTGLTRFPDIIRPGLRIADPGREPWSRSGVPVLAAVCNDEKNKGLKRLKDLFCGLACRFPGLPLRLHVAGSITGARQHEHCLNRYLSRRSRARVRFCGYLSSEELAGLVRRSHFFVVPSFYESWCMAAAESLGQGTPVLNLSRGGIRSYLKDGYNGFHLHASDGRGLESAVMLPLRDSACYERLRSASLVSGRNLPSWRASAARLTAVIEREMKCREAGFRKPWGFTARK